MGRKQYAALPFRKQSSGLHILLITTRNKRRWSIPKGDPIGRSKPHRTAAIEAFEEAGLVGAVRKRPIGKFRHRKGRGAGKEMLHVSVYPMKVRGRQRWWPEKEQRKAIWVSADAATEMVHKPQLRQLIARFAASYDE
jgi:8-oxo-dGTP pyrophosphatase MutT (NUDIX family)